MTYAAQRPTVSIIVPVYNVAADLDRCVESLVSQTLRDIEILLVDDGSTDASGKLCDEWVGRDERIRVVHKENGGLSSARNAGMEVARGDYFGFVDSDDYVDTRMYEAMLSAFASDEVSIVTCGRYVHMGEFVKEDFCGAEKTVYNAEEAMREVLLGRALDVSACDKLYRRELFDSIRYPEGRISEDAAIILPMLAQCEKVVNCGESFYHYVFRMGSISKSRYSHKKFDVMRNCMEMTEWVEENAPELKDALGSFCCMQMTAMIEDMINTPGARLDCADDYVAYWEMMRRCYGDYLKVGGHPKKEIARVVATRTHLYRVFWAARRVWNGVKKNGWNR